MRKVGEESPEPPVRGDRLWRALERPFLAADRWLGRGLRPAESPLARTGALAFFSFVIAVASGVPLLFWYEASPARAHASLAGLGAAGAFVRAVHRYSSDACLLFSAIHAFRLLVARRTGGARWLAWVTGVGLVGLLWLVGWLGYWLVWDERARQVALGSARLADVVPIFAQPLSLSFVADDAVRPLLFFVVFFLHMLLPLAMGALLWLHLARLQRPRWWPSRALAAGAAIALVALSLALPADLAAPARMAETPEAFTIDAWYLAPLVLTDRLGAGALWALVLGAGALGFAVPWLLAGRRRPPAAVVEPSRCNGCNACVTDCPYGAIVLAPRSDGRQVPGLAVVDPAACLACGICAGSCDSNGIDVPQKRVQPGRARLDRWLEAGLAAARAAGAPPPLVAFACAGSAAGELDVDPATGRAPGLPGYLVEAVPCAGWVHPLLVERVFRHGAAGVLVVSCAHGEPMYREGPETTAARLAGKRVPALRAEKVDPRRVRVVALDRGQRRALLAEAEAHRRALAGDTPRLTRETERPRPRALRLATGASVAAVLTAAVGAGSAVPYRTGLDARPRLVVAFVHAGQAGTRCRTATPEELAAQPVHMRQERVCERGRAAVRVRVSVDGEVVHDRRHAPGGVFGDGPAVVHERIGVAPGVHVVEIAIADDGGDEWSFEERRELEFASRRARVVRFDRARRFTWD